MKSMSIRKLLIVEVIIIGLLTMLLQLVIYRAITGTFPSPKLDHYNEMLLGGFLLGSSLHLILEVVGANESWCRHTYK